MGAWDVSAFGNDDASDMISELLEHSNPNGYLNQIFAYAAKSDYLEGREGSQMVAAAAIVAAATQKAFNGAPPFATSWIDENESMLRELASPALDAVSRVSGDNSELRNLWHESGEFQAWIAELERISAALG